MTRLARALVLGCAVFAGCTATKTADPSRAESAAGPVVLTPSLAGVDARLLPELERVQGLVAEGNYAAARSVLDALLARESSRLSGRSLEVARAFERVLDLDPTFLPSLQALEAAVEAGSDREAAAILRRIEMRKPRGRVLEIAQAYRRILDGRLVVSSLELKLECRGEEAADLPADAPEGARFARLYLVAECSLEESVEIETGPATLFVTRSTLGRNAMEHDAVETKTFDGLKSLRVERGKPGEVALARFYVSAAPGDFASRLRFELDVRAGSARLRTAAEEEAAAEEKKEESGRDVPLMRLRVRPAELTALTASLRDLPPASPEELHGAATSSGRVDLARALAIAVRIPPQERERTLDLLGAEIETLPEESVRALVPSLRWIAVTAEPGGGPNAWRSWFRERERRKAGERPKLLLPRTAPTG